MRLLPTFFTTKRFGLTGLACLIALILPTGFVAGRGWLTTTFGTAKAAAVRKPYTITTEDRTACYVAGDEAGAENFSLVFTTVRAVRGDGSIAEETIEPQRKSVQREIRLQPNTKVHVLDHRGSRFSYTGGPDVSVMQPDPGTNCALNFGGGRFISPKAQLEGFEAIQGLNSVRFKVPGTGDNYHTVWFALDYGCEVVKLESWDYNKMPDGRTGVTHSLRSLVSVKDGEPDPALFDVSKAVETKPSDAMINDEKLWRESIGQTVKNERVEKMRKAHQKRDALWESQHEKK